MGTDIYGYIECKYSFRNTWTAVMNLGHIYHARDYDSFGCFFGVRNFANFRPLAEDRGFPEDVSQVVIQAYEEQQPYAYTPTWISWQEIQQIDWEEESEEIDSRINRYVRNEKGELIWDGKAAWEREFAERVGYDQCDSTRSQEWDLGDVVYRTEKMKRLEVRPSWEDTFAVLEILAHHYKDDGVRLVVWFD